MVSILKYYMYVPEQCVVLADCKENRNNYNKKNF